MSVTGASDIVRQAVSAWPGVESGPHRFGGVEYRVGTREIGRMHGDYLVDIPFPTRIRNQLVSVGAAEPHHILPETGWISFYIRKESDVAHAVALLRQSYEIALQQRGRQGAG